MDLDGRGDPRDLLAKDFYRLRSLRRMKFPGSYAGVGCARRISLACLITFERAFCENDERVRLVPRQVFKDFRICRKILSI